MVLKKSLDPYRQIIAALLCDVQTLHGRVFTERALRLTTAKVEKRIAEEGLGFLTKALPRLGKALDKALSGEQKFDAAGLGFKTKAGSQLPSFLGELFECVFSSDGCLLPNPCINSIKTLRQVLFVFYKLELPYSPDLERKVIEKFIKTDQSLKDWNDSFRRIDEAICRSSFDKVRVKPDGILNLIRNARVLLSDLFANFDPLDIHPRHGPGAVATKQRLSEKYVFTEISPRILQSYPLDAYFFASNGHVCDELVRDNSIKLVENSARVCLVPKDSRGPRLISCEPVDFQWIQQGLGRAIVQLVESHPLTRYNVHFTDQQPNQFGALFGSLTGKYSTLDLNEASDRVTTGLVHLLFPKHVVDVLMNCRSQTTILPDKSKITLEKFAPMGSALCFPILALTIWALLTSGLSDAVQTRRGRKIKSTSESESVLVYGDDVVVPTAKAANAIEILESFGLKINRDKSFSSGFFRESCGVDAYKGCQVTPVRLRTVWTSHRSPESYTSYIAFANLMYKGSYYHVYDVVVKILLELYQEIPEVSMGLPCPSLVDVPEKSRNIRRRVNVALQKQQWLVWDIITPKVRQEIGGWKMLLRYFAEATDQKPLDPWNSRNVSTADACDRGEFAPFSVSSYTRRKTSCLVKRWR